MMTGLERYTKKTKCALFLEEMEQVVPRRECALIEPYYPKAGNGRPPVGVERMLRIYFLHQWFNLSDPGVEEALYDSAFCGSSRASIWGRSRTGRDDGMQNRRQRLNPLLNRVATNGFGLLRQGQQFWIVLRVNVDLAVTDEHRHIIPDVVVCQLATTLVGGGGRFVGGDLGLLSRLVLPFRQSLALLLELGLLLRRSYAGPRVSVGVCRLPLNLTVSPTNWFWTL